MQAEGELPLHKERLSERVLKLWICDQMQSIAVIALATEKGIVVIDTNLQRSVDTRIRKAIEEEFGRSDFKYLINTHHHHDHTAGNQVYADLTIIGHRNLRAGMEGELTGDGLVALVEKFKGMKQFQQEEIKKHEPGTDEYVFNKEFLTLLDITLDEFSSGFVPTYPSIMYEKNMSLDMGDMTIELYSFGGLHADSATVIFVPEEGLVEVGDHPPDPILPSINKELTSDFSVTLDNWGRILSSGWEIKHVLEAHWDMPLSVEGFREQYNYLNTLWNGVAEMIKEGKTLEEAKEQYTIEKDFPQFKDVILEVRDISIHEYNIESMWEKQTKKNKDNAE